MKQPVRVAVTGAAGNISYALLFRIAAGDMLGKDQPVILQLLEIPPAMDALNGVVMELNDCAFPLVSGIVASDDPNVAFKDNTNFLSVEPGDYEVTVVPAGTKTAAIGPAAISVEASKVYTAIARDQRWAHPQPAAAFRHQHLMCNTNGTARLC